MLSVADKTQGLITVKIEFFLDSDDVMYRRQQNGKHQLVVPQTLIQDVIRENHDPKYVAYSEIKRTYSLISLNYWWPKMRENVEQYLRRCDPCQRRKENREMIAPLGVVEEPKIPFEVTSMDITGPYPTMPRESKHLLTFIDHLTKYVEAFPIPDHAAETCARVYSSQIVTRHGSSSTLITDQGREFVIFLPKNVQNIRRPQGAYFRLSCVIKWDGGKALQFRPFRLIALRKCKS